MGFAHQSADRFLSLCRPISQRDVGGVAAMLLYFPPTPFLDGYMNHGTSMIASGIDLLSPTDRTRGTSWALLRTTPYYTISALHLIRKHTRCGT